MVQFFLCVMVDAVFAVPLVKLWDGYPWPLCAAVSVLVALVVAAEFGRMWWRLRIHGFKPLTAGQGHGGFGFASMQILGPFVLPLVLPLLAGMMLAMFLSTLCRDFPGEKTAKAALDICAAT